jgi:hypothetical protein
MSQACIPVHAAWCACNAHAWTQQVSCSLPCRLNIGHSTRMAIPLQCVLVLVVVLVLPSLPFLAQAAPAAPSIATATLPHLQNLQNNTRINMTADMWRQSVTDQRKQSDEVSKLRMIVAAMEDLLLYAGGCLQLCAINALHTLCCVVL